MASGMNALTGQRLDGISHLRQSIIDILTTPIGSRVMQRDYGSRLFELIDAPMNAQTLVEIYAATVEALSIWEKRLVIESVSSDAASPGVLVLSITGKYLPDGQDIEIEGIQVS